MNQYTNINPVAIETSAQAPVDDLLGSLQLQKESDLRLSGSSLVQIFDHVYGGQLIAQGIIAAASLLTGQRRNLLHSTHTQFLRAGSTSKSIAYQPSALTNGRSFSGRLVNAYQGDRQLLTMTASFQDEQPGPLHSEQMPAVPDPLSLDSAIEFFRHSEGLVADFLYQNSPFDLRHVNGHLYTQPDHADASPHRIWIRPRTIIPQNHQITHRALLAYATDQLMMEPLLKRQGLYWQTPGLALASLDYSIWFHHDIDINQWHLFEGVSPAASGSRALVNAQIFNQEGQLVASLAQQAMIRVSHNNEDAGRWSFDGRGIKDSNT